jgi:hypothetical protein
MNQLTLKTVKNAWAKSLSVLDNPYVNLTLVIVLILYSSKMFGNINEVINGLYQYTFIKLLVLLIIAYVAPKDTNIAILLAISYVMSLKNINMESFFVSDIVKNIGSDVSDKIVINTCNDIASLNKALSMYMTINNGLYAIINSLNSLQDTDLEKPIKSLTDSNIIINKVITNIQNSINEKYNSINEKYNSLPIGKKCSPPSSAAPLITYTIPGYTAPNTTGTVTKISFCGVTKEQTANDNILISMAYMADNIRINSVATTQLARISGICLGLINGINSLITSVNLYLIPAVGSKSISDDNGIVIINALTEAKKVINTNITYSQENIKIFKNNMVRYICDIVRDPTYINLIKNLSGECKNIVATKLFTLINMDLIDQYGKVKGIINENLPGLTAKTIFTQNATWLKNCPEKNPNVKPLIVGVIENGLKGIPTNGSNLVGKINGISTIGSPPKNK